MAGDESQRGACSPELSVIAPGNGAEPQVVGLAPQNNTGEESRHHEDLSIQKRRPRRAQSRTQRATRKLLPSLSSKLLSYTGALGGIVPARRHNARHRRGVFAFDRSAPYLLP